MDVLSWIEHVLENNTSASGINIDWKWFRLLRLSNWPAVSSWDRIIRSGQLSHQGISRVIVKVHTTNIGVIKRRGTSSSLVVATAACAIEGTTTGGRLRTAATGSRE